MRISDWSSDVCSSDLLEDNGVTGETADLVEIDGNEAIDALRGEEVDAAIFVGAPTSRTIGTLLAKIGRASCRDRECPYVSISGVAVSLKNTNSTTSLQQHPTHQKPRVDKDTFG